MAAAFNGRPVGSSSKILVRDKSTLQKLHDKHGTDFGAIGKFKHGKNEGEVSRAIHQHINAPETLSIEGKFRGRPAKFYLDPNTGLNVVVSPADELLGGWKLSPEQQSNVLLRRQL
ncbi:MAG: hypothetical protein IPG04_40260 [Polyangiaceae bacterium]|nr:hypothetical protein [Polyangiaceae bacterium]